MFIADTQSQAYLNETVEDIPLSDDIEVMAHRFIQEIPASPEKSKQMKEETAKDEALQVLKTQIAEGFPTHRKALKPILMPHWNIRNKLSEADGLLFKGRQLIIPKTMQSSTLDLIHESHLGIEKCKACARANYCVLAWNVTRHPWHGWEVFHLPDTQTQQSKGTDDSPRHTRSLMAKARIWCIWAHKGKLYLVVVDYYSKFIETSLMRAKTEGTIVMHMKSIFARHGIPEELVSDNMPYNSKEFKHFVSDWGFKLTTSSPTYPQANGVSEKAVQTIKRILKNTSTLAIHWPFGVQKHPSDRNDILPITAPHESCH